MTTYPLQDLACRRSSMFFLIVTAVALVLPGCAGEDGQGEPVTVADTPDWIEKIYPAPDSETSATRAVQVLHTAIPDNRQVRLSIDGTDVTVYASGSDPGLLVYDMDDPNAPVPLRPGEHTAEVELVRRTPGSGEGTDSYDPDVHEVIDSYSWEFRIL